jgi:hypothetical protein
MSDSIESSDRSGGWIGKKRLQIAKTYGFADVTQPLEAKVSGGYIFIHGILLDYLPICQH